MLNAQMLTELNFHFVFI